MKIHGTTKGGALSTKDFGVAFGGAAALCELAATDFDVVDNWTQSPTGTVTWSGGTATNYARNSTLITGSNWEFTCNPEDSNWGTNTICRAGVSLTTTPNDSGYFNFDWLIYDGGAGDKIYYHRSKPDGSDTIQTATDYESGAIYTIKCVDNVVTFSKSGAAVGGLPFTVPSSYNFDADVNTAAYMSVGAAQVQADVVWICESYVNCTP